MIIAAASCFLFIGCAKVDVTPGANKASVSEASASEARQLLPPDGYYTITNTETEWGVVEYRVQFTDCDGKFNDVPLLMKESITVCLQNGEATTNFARTIERVK
jgi:hypothetical protein